MRYYERDERTGMVGIGATAAEAHAERLRMNAELRSRERSMPVMVYTTGDIAGQYFGFGGGSSSLLAPQEPRVAAQPPQLTTCTGCGKQPCMCMRAIRVREEGQ